MSHSGGCSNHLNKELFNLGKHEVSTGPSLKDSEGLSRLHPNELERQSDFRVSNNEIQYLKDETILKLPANLTHIIKGKRLHWIAAISNWQLFILNRYWNLMGIADGNDAL